MPAKRTRAKRDQDENVPVNEAKGSLKAPSKASKKSKKGTAKRSNNIKNTTAAEASPLADHTTAASTTPDAASQFQQRLTEAIEGALQAHTRGVADSNADTNPDGEEDEAVYWRKKYNQLKDLRQTKPEKAYNELMETMARREEEIVSAVAELRNDMQVVPAPPTPQQVPQQPQAQATPEADSSASSTRLAELERKVEAQREMIHYYQTLTGCVVKLDEDEMDLRADDEEDDECATAHCALISYMHKKAVKFDLKLGTSEDEEEVTFVPTGNSKLMPSALQEEIRFETKQTPVLLQQLIGSVFSN